MPKPWSILLGALSLAPLLGFVTILVLVSTPASASNVNASTPHLLFQIGAAYVVASWLVIIGAVVLALRSSHLRGGQKVLWVLALFVLNMFVLPVFWYQHVWRRSSETAT